MKTIKINHYQACDKAVVNFSIKEKINIRTSEKFYLNSNRFGATPWPFAGLPVVYCVFNAEGRALYAGMSKDSTGQNNYFTVDDVTGQGVEKEPWPNGKPDHIIFYCLSEHPLGGNETRYQQMLELRRCIRKVISEETTPPTWPSIASLMEQVPVSEICRHLPWISNRQVTELENWQKILSDKQSVCMVDDIWKYYLYMSSLDFGNTLPKIDINMVILNTEDVNYFVPLDNKLKDLAFISKLPVYSENQEAEPWQTALNILLRVSGIQLDPDA